MPSLLREMITNYKDDGSRVDEVLFQQVMAAVDQLEVEKRRNKVKILKERKGIPTVIEYNGDRFVFQSDTTARGGVRRGKQPNKGQAYKT